MNTITLNRSARFALATAAVGVLGLSGCAAGGGDGESTAAATETSAATAAATDTGAATDGAQQMLTVQDPWMKAADSGMTAVFGTLTNDGDSAVTLSGAEATGIAESAELHETAMDESTGSTVMQEMTDPLVIEPGESVTLEPGADHIMLMDLTCAPMAGQNLNIQLAYADGEDDENQTVKVPVRDYQGAQEEYSHEGGGSTMSPSEMPSHMASAMPSMGAMHSDQDDELPMCQESQ